MTKWMIKLHQKCFVQVVAEKCALFFSNYGSLIQIDYQAAIKDSFEHAGIFIYIGKWGLYISSCLFRGFGISDRQAI